MKKRTIELLHRLRLWLEKDKNCRHCCMTCEYFEMCNNE